MHEQAMNPVFKHSSNLNTTMTTKVKGEHESEMQKKVTNSPKQHRS